MAVTEANRKYAQMILQRYSEYMDDRFQDELREALDEDYYGELIGYIVEAASYCHRDMLDEFMSETFLKG